MIDNNALYDYLFELFNLNKGVYFTAKYIGKLTGIHPEVMRVRLRNLVKLGSICLDIHGKSYYYYKPKIIPEFQTVPDILPSSSSSCLYDDLISFSEGEMEIEKFYN